MEVDSEELEQMDIDSDYNMDIEGGKGPRGKNVIRGNITIKKFILRGIGLALSLDELKSYASYINVAHYGTKEEIINRINAYERLSPKEKRQKKKGDLMKTVREQITVVQPVVDLTKFQYSKDLPKSGVNRTVFPTADELLFKIVTRKHTLAKLFMDVLECASIETNLLKVRQPPKSCKSPSRTNKPSIRTYQKLEDIID